MEPASTPHPAGAEPLSLNMICGGRPGPGPGPGLSRHHSAVTGRQAATRQQFAAVQVSE